MRSIFLSYEFRHDAWKAQAIRSVWLASGGVVTLEAKEASSDWEIKQWIDHTLRQAEVTVVLVGPNTASSRWVEYEVQLSKSLGKGLLGIDVVGMAGEGVCEPGPPLPMLAGYPMYDWVKDDGERQLGSWVLKANAQRTLDRTEAVAFRAPLEPTTERP